MKLRTSLVALVGGLITISACTNNSSGLSNLPQQDQVEQVSASSVRDNTVVEIKLKNAKDDLIGLSTKGYDLFGYNAKTKTIRARVSKDEQDALTKGGFSIKVSPEKNMVKGSGLLPGYMTYAQMKAKLQSLAAQNPDIAVVSDIGDTWEKTQGKSPNNDIWCITITSKKNTKSNKAGSLFIGGMHARELAPPEIMVKLADTLISGYGKDPAITDLVDNREINIVPMVNVDGRIQVEKGNAWQRKNTHGQGVDLNRNFDSHWNYQGLNVPSSWHGDDSNQGSETYSGSGPASEPEVQAVQNFYNGRNLKLVLDMHSYGEMFFWPVGYSDADIPEAPFFRNMYNNTFKKINYQGGTSMALLYPTTATTDDYAYVKHHIMGLGMEIGESFRPSYSEVETMWSQLKPNLLYLIKASNSSMTGSK